MAYDVLGRAGIDHEEDEHRASGGVGADLFYEAPEGQRETDFVSSFTKSFLCVRAVQLFQLWNELPDGVVSPPLLGVVKPLNVWWSWWMGDSNLRWGLDQISNELPPPLGLQES